MRDSIWNVRMPTVFGLLLLLVGVAVTSYLTQTGVIFTSRASAAHTPENIRITNVSSDSFTISYTTAEKNTGVISYGKDKNLTQTANDDRNGQADPLTPHLVHHVTLRNLSPSTKYYFSITSGPDTFLKNGELFEATTASSISTNPTKQQPITGKILTPDGKETDEAIVYLTTDGAQMISTLVKNGKYTVALNTMRTTDLSRYITLNDTSLIKILAVGSSTQSNATINTKQATSMPTITLSQDYDFTASSSPVASSSAQIGFPALTADSTSNIDPTIVTPKKGESFTDQKPLFRGTAQPNSTVTISIHSNDQIQETITADKSGRWSYRPTQALSAGQHTIAITTRDQFGILKTITQSFTVYAAGSQVDQSATPSASLTTPTPVVSSTPIPTILPTNTPFPTPTTAEISQINPTITASPTGDVAGATMAPSIGTKGGVMESPGTNSTLITVAAALTTAIGIALFFFSRAGSL